MKVIPYLRFQGNCEEALYAYQEIFNGEIEEINRYDNPAMPVPEAYMDKIMHTELTFNHNTIMLADLMPDQTVSHGNGYSISLNLTDLEQATKIFNQLAAGGNIWVAFEKQFWGSWFGQLDDRFGINWMLMCNEE